MISGIRFSYGLNENCAAVACSSADGLAGVRPGGERFRNRRFSHGTEHMIPLSSNKARHRRPFQIGMS